ncbi:hypothetical protein [Neptunicoccus cionae]|uniref:hypothetical protein n=1 Tax=Neptunicoccus cionae TaxID=2035344 RepID=UPI000C773B0E|nr:hypothetical protein [Amylibacter cionae]PLS22260.1 hypothetical protein C0U40_07495 [Amylibacter cionae]
MRVRQLALCGALLGVLASCDRGTAPEGGAIRDDRVMMSATSRYDAGRFAGDWVTRADFGGDWRISGFSFDAGRWVEVGAIDSSRRAARVTPDQPAVFTLAYGGLNGAERQMVVLWVDEGFRTAALSTRDGSAAFIVDRKATGGADRIAAAVSALEHNGFDVARLRVE